MTFHAIVNTNDAKIKLIFDAEGSQFQSTLECDGGTIGHLKLDNCTFNQDLSLKNLTIKDSIILKNVKTENLIRLYGTHTGRLSGEKITCREFQAESVAVDQNFELSGEISNTINLHGMNIGGTLKIENTQAPRLLASFITIQRGAVFRESSFEEIIDIEGAFISGVTDLGNLKIFPKELNIKGGNLGSIYLTSDDQDQDNYVSTKIDLSDCVYAFLQCDHKKLMECFSDPSNRQPYLSLEKMLRRRGHEPEADDVYAFGRRKTRPQEWNGHSSWIFKKFFDIAADWITGYGVEIWRICTFIFLTWLIGAYHFTLSPTSRHISTNEIQAITTNIPPVCDLQNKFDLFQGAWLSFKTLIPAPSPDGCWSVDLFSWGSILIIAILKLTGLMLFPVFLAMLSGLFRPAARS